MNSLVFALLCFQSPHLADFDRAVRAVSQRSAGRVNVAAEASSAGITKTVRFELAYQRPGTVWLRTMRPAAGGMEASDRELLLNGARLIGYDRMAEQVLRRPAIAQGTLLERTAIAFGEIDESLQVVLDPGVLRKFLDQFRSLGGWTRTSSAGVVRLVQKVNVQGKASKVEIGIEASSGLLRTVEVDSLQGRLKWTYAWSSGKPPATLSVPPGARPVQSFVDRPILTVDYADQKAEAAARKVIEATNRLRHLDAVVNGASVSFSGQRLAERRKDYAYAYDGRTLTVVDHRSKTVATGPVPMTSLRRTLGNLKIAMDPWLASYASGDRLLKPLLPSGALVRHAGSIRDQGSECDILAISAPGIRVSIWARKSDALPVRITADSLGGDGRAFASSERVIAYDSVNKPLSAAAFKVASPAGYTKKGLK